MDDDPVREWLAAAVTDVAGRWEAEPDTAWDEWRPVLIADLGLGDPAEHPAAALLIGWVDQLGDDGSRIEALSLGELVEAAAAHVAAQAGAQVEAREQGGDDAVSAAADRDTNDVADSGGDRLAWATAEQQAMAEEHYGDAWRTELASKLDERWGDGWEANPQEHKRAWLDGLLPNLILPFADIDLTEEVTEQLVGVIAEVGAQALGQLEARLAELATELGVTEDELRDELASLSDADLSQAIAGVFADGFE